MNIGDDQPTAAQRRRVRPQSHRACVHCQRRKTRCSGTDDGTRACAYCRATGKTCSFADPRAGRTPLTRINLNSAEKERRKLRLLLETLNPDLDVDAALVALDGHQQQEDEEGHEEGQGSRSDGPSIMVDEGSDEAASSERYEWQESHRPTSKDGASSLDKDGMAILPSVNAGYLGRSSGSDMFQEVTALLPASVRLRPRRESSSQTHPSQEQRADFDPAWLPASSLTDGFVDAYFQLYNVSYPILHEATFRAEMALQTRTISSSTTWRIIYYMVLAIGHWLCSSTAGGSSSTLEQCPYYAAARSRVSMQLLEAGSTRTVQGFLLMGNYLQKRDRPNTGYNLIGLAHRIAVGIGLHREKPLATEDTIMLERNRQLFWVLYCFDSGFNITTGRPIAAMEGFIDQSLPRNIDDRDGVLSSPTPRPVEHPTTYSALIAHAGLARIANGMYQEFLSARTSNAKVEYQIAEMMDHRLKTWRNDLPDYFSSPPERIPSWFNGPRTIVLWKEQNLRILLWRETKRHHPFLPTQVDSKRRCLDAAMETIHAISSYCTLEKINLHANIAWYATYFIFQATLVLEASHLSRHSGPDEVLPSDYDSWQASVAVATACLETLSKYNQAASVCLDIISHIHTNQTQQPRDTEAEVSRPNMTWHGDGNGNGDGLFDSLAWMSQETVTDPILRTMIDEVFWGADATGLDASGLLGEGDLDFS